MVNFAAALKEEIRRLAKREVKANTSATKQAVARYRREIARLKRLVHQQERKTAFLEAQERKRLGQAPAAGEPAEHARYSPRSVRAQRKRLRLSAKDYGKLVGVSGLTIYNWELGKARPRKAQLGSLVAVRGIGKREAAAKLALLRAAEQRAAGKPRKVRRKRAK